MVIVCNCLCILEVTYKCDFPYYVYVHVHCLLQRTLVALCRDLAGIARSFTSKTSYMMLFDWMYPYSYTAPS